MTVAELIEELNSIEDKTKPVYYDYDDEGIYVTEVFENKDNVYLL